MMSNAATVQALKLTLHGVFVGVLTHHSSNRNKLVFAPEYAASINRPTFTLSQVIDPDYLLEPLTSSQQVAPVLSNLLPEGSMRKFISQTLKVDVNNEFALLAYFRDRLPGALILEPLEIQDIPAWVGEVRKGKFKAVTTPPALEHSLAGVQVKFSGNKNHDGRYNLNPSSINTSIIKTPSTIHKNVPENEYSSMLMAEAIGVIIPKVSLIQLDSLDNLPDIQLPNEKHAYTIERFDRAESNGIVSRVHMEDFAQILGTYSHDKYSGANYELIGRIIYEYSEHGIADIQQMARRLLANILLGNGDAHLKNWSMFYPNQIDAALSPAYDIHSTFVYILGERQLAFKMGGENDWYKISMTHFEAWAKKVGVRWPAIKSHIQDAMSIARATWPDMLASLPMSDDHKKKITDHWRNLSDDFKI